MSVRPASRLPPSPGAAARPGSGASSTAQPSWRGGPLGAGLPPLPPRRRAVAAAAAADSAAGGAQQPLWDAAYSGEGLVLGAPPGAASSRGADGDHAAALAAALHDVTGIDRERARALVDAAGPRLLEAGLGPAFDVFRLYVQHAGAARGALDDLARALLEGGAAGVLCAPPADFRAALRFVEDQLPRLSRRRFEALRRPDSLARLVSLHPAVAGRLLRQHPRAFEETAAPWLREALEWGDAEVAGAALSPHYCELCRLDTAAAQRNAGWLVADVGLSRRQAGLLLAQDPRLLLFDPPRLQRFFTASVERAAGQWGVGTPLATALVVAHRSLVLPPATLRLTGQLVELLRDVVGMGEDAQLDFVLGGGLDGASTASERALGRATQRLRRLHLVYGAWPPLAAALAEAPELLHTSWLGVKGLLHEEHQQAVWWAIAAVEQLEEGAGGGGQAGS